MKIVIKRFNIISTHVPYVKCINIEIFLLLNAIDKLSITVGDLL